MKIENYPRLTVILRDYSYEEAMYIIDILKTFDHKVGVEITTNNNEYLKIIKDSNDKYGNLIYIGVGTVLNISHAQEAIDTGAQFMLGPNAFTPDIFEIAKKHNVITVPAAMTPTEVNKMFADGADIVKVFPAITVQPSFFKQLQGPYGSLNLMAVGGINLTNIKNFVDAGVKYIGIGSSMFRKEDIEEKNDQNIINTVKNYLDIIY